MIKILLNNTKSIISGDTSSDFKVISSIRNKLKMRHPNFFYVSQHTDGRWDGFQYDIDKTGKFLTGFLPRITKMITDDGHQYSIYDNRIVPEVKENFEGLRDYQITSVKSLLNNKVGGISFMRGIINAEMNAGKTHIMIAIFKSFPNSSGIILLNDSDLFDQFLDDMPKFFEESEWGYLRGKQFKVGRVMVVMVQTLVKRLKVVNGLLSQMDIVCIDECDLATSKTYTKVLNSLVNTSIRVGLSGTIFLSKLKKYAFKINPIIGFTGEEIYAITSKELIKKKISSPIVVKILQGNTKQVETVSYEDTYKKYISLSQDRAEKILQRVIFNHSRGRVPMVIVCRFHEHVDYLYEYLLEYLKFENIVISKVHHRTPNRKEIFDRIKRGQIHVLISSLIIKRGKNIPILKVIINAASGDSPETTLQVLGRGLRTHDSKKKTYIEDFYDNGNYIEKHSKHRINYYKNKEYKVLLLKNKNYE